MRYRTAHNFLGRRVPGYRESTCILTRQAAEALARVQEQVTADGLTLKVYDCYRPQRSVDAFVAWAKDLDDTRMKAEFYPRVRKDRLFEDGYIAEQSGHSRGSTVDLTLVRTPPRRQERYERGDRLRDCAARPGSASGTTRSTWARATTASTRCRTPTTDASGASSAPTASCSASR
jgi:D-alanyl-D-alanine dipeptidase